jgi:hypothetical protein
MFGFYPDWLHDIGRLLVIIAPIALLQFGLTLAGIISIVRKPAIQGNEKIVWLLLVVLVSIVGPIIYFAIGSAKLDEIAARQEEERLQQREGIK